MSENKFTPGPWRVDPNHLFDIQTVDGRLEISTTHEGILVGGIKPDLLEQKANARLIAAAPELLAALHEAADYIGDRSAGSSRFWDLYDTAIAKARANHE